MKVTEKEFGRKDGQPVTAYTLTNDQGFQLTCINYGCIITEILAPDRTGNLENVVLGFDTLEEYQKDAHFLGTVVGRFAGRIKDGSFALQGKDYQLDRNANGHNLHGGPGGFHSIFWKSTVVKDENGATVEFTHVSPDGEEGFPGNLSMTVRYTLKNDRNQLVISYSGESDKTTLLNVTNHSYFNLSGDLKRTILDHEVVMKSDHYLELDGDLLPTGTLVAADADPLFDFRSGRRIGDAVESDHPQAVLAGHGYDHPFLLDQQAQPAIEATDPESGRKLSIETTEPAVVLYTGNALQGPYTIRETEAGNHLGLCFETQRPPDSVRHPHFPSAILKAGEVFRSETVYSFSVAGEKEDSI